MSFTPVLDMPEIISLSGENIRPLVEGSQVTQHGIICIGESNDKVNFSTGDDILKIFALVMKCSSTSEPPHSVKLSIKRGTPNKVVKWWCSCTGGNGRCKHTLATAFRLYRLTVDNLEKISCTDVTQLWGKSSMQKWSDTLFKGTAVQNMCHFRPKKPASPIIMPYMFGKRVREKFTIEGDPESELSKFRKGNRCIMKKQKDTTVHKSLKRAVLNVTTCPLNTAAAPQIGRKGKPKIPLSSVQGCNSSLNGEKENCPGPKPTKQLTTTPHIARTTAPRRVLHDLQNEANSNHLEYNTSTTSRENHPAVNGAGRTSGIPPYDRVLRTYSRNSIAEQQATPNFFQPNVAEESGLNLLAAVCEETCSIQQRTSSADTSTRTGETAQTNVLSDTPAWVVRREQWKRTRLQRCGPPLPTSATKDYIDGLVRKPLQINLKNGPYFTSAEDESYFLSKVCVTPGEAADVCVSSMAQSSCEVWSRERKKRFTASKCYGLFTPKTPVDDTQFWREKLQRFFSQNFVGNFNTSRGLEDEAFARGRYENVFGTTVEVLGLVVHPEAPWLGCSPDGIVAGNILLEVKSPESGIVNPAGEVVKNQRYIKRDKDGNMTLSNRHPYYGQVQLGMALTGLKMCHFVVYSSFDDSIAVVKVPFNCVFADALVQKLTDIYFKHYLKILREANC